MLKSAADLIFSPIAEIHFAGFKSTGHDLQRAGWQVSAYEMNHDRYEGVRKNVQLMFFHDRNRITMVTEMVFFDVREMMSASRDFEMQYMCKPPTREIFKVIGFNIHNGPTNIIANYKHESVEFMFREQPVFRPVDMMPRYNKIDLDGVDLRRWGVFKQIDDTKNIFLPEKTIDELMKDILKKQEPAQKDIRAKRRTKEFMKDNFGENDRMPGEEIKLQLVAF